MMCYELTKYKWQKIVCRSTKLTFFSLFVGLKGKTPEPQASKKKPMPFVGKMPRKRDLTSNRDSSSPAKSKFGPPSGTNVPPPGVVTTPANPTTPAPIPPKPLQPPTPPTTFTMAPRYQPPPPVSVSAQFGGIRAPKNPTPKSVDMKVKH